MVEMVWVRVHLDSPHLDHGDHLGVHTSFPSHHEKAVPHGPSSEASTDHGGHLHDHAGLGNHRGWENVLVQVAKAHYGMVEVAVAG